MTDQEVREQVRARYAAAARAVTAHQSDPLAVVDNQCCGPVSATSTAGCCASDAQVDASFGSALYSADEQAELPAEAVAASLGCGNPMMVADLKPGEKVLDLGSGGGIDVLLSARRVGPDRLRVRGRHDAGDARPRAGQRRQSRSHQRGVPQGHHRAGPAARQRGRRRDLQLRDQPVARQARGAGRDVPGAHPGRADRHLRRRRRGPPVGRRPGRARFVRRLHRRRTVPQASTWRAWPRSASPKRRSPSPTRPHPACTAPSSTPPNRSRHRPPPAAAPTPPSRPAAQAPPRRTAVVTPPPPPADAAASSRDPGAELAASTSTDAAPPVSRRSG